MGKTKTWHRSRTEAGARDCIVNPVPTATIREQRAKNGIGITCFSDQNEITNRRDVRRRNDNANDNGNEGWTASGTDRRTVRTPCACVASSQPRSRDPASAWSVRVRGNGGSTRYSAPPKKTTRQKLSSSMAIVQRQLRAETPNTGNYLVNKFKMDSAQNQ